jgi:hypothetical protein
MRPAVVVLLVLAAATGAGAVALATAGGDDETPRACRDGVRDAVLPSWARAGFSEREPRVPHAVGRDGRIAAVVFGHPLTSPPLRDRANKILWVPREPLTAPAALTVDAQRMEGAEAVGEPVRRVIEDGPGPSTVDLPAPGCWRLTLRWADGVDALDLRYRQDAG